MKKYFLAISGNTQGPYTPTELKALGLTLDSFVWCEGFTDWKKASEIPELAELFVEPKVEEKASKKPGNFPKSVLIVGLVLILAVILGLFYQFFLKGYLLDLNAPRYYTLADGVVFRSSPVAQVEYNKLLTLDYGAEILVYENNRDWVKGKSREQEGYISGKYVVNRKDFLLLNSIFTDSDSRSAIETAKCRQAILDYFKDNGYRGKMDSVVYKEVYEMDYENQESTAPAIIEGEWQIYTKGKGKYPNTVFYPRLYNSKSKYTDFAVIIRNNQDGYRKLLIFSFSDTDETATLIHESPAPEYGDILSMRVSPYNPQDIITTYTTN
jgi:hypothetical protein